MDSDLKTERGNQFATEQNYTKEKEDSLHPLEQYQQQLPQKLAEEGPGETSL